jgi:tRNA 2-thiouridine synthesizing protein B
MILHTFSKSPFSSNSILNGLARSGNTDSILFMQDAVYASQDAQLTKELSGYSTIYLLQDDIQARGLSVTDSLYKLIDYDDFVDLTLSCKHVVSW